MKYSLLFINLQRIVVLICCVGCTNFLEVGPPKSELVTPTVFQNNNTANAAMTAIYSLMVSDMEPYNYPLYCGLYADELENYTGGAYSLAFYRNSLDPTTYQPRMWNTAYKYIYNANAVIEGCTNSTGLDNDVKKQLIAEAQFIRAYWYFYLVNLYGDLPLILTTDYRINAMATKASVNEIYHQIIANLQEAAQNLDEAYVDGSAIPGTSERVRPNVSTANALLARVSLFTQDFANAELYATMVIDNSSLYDTVSLDQVFLKNSREAIWQLPPSSGNTWYNTQEGSGFIIYEGKFSFQIDGYVSQHLIDAFEPGDLRRTHWIGEDPTYNIYYPHKYKQWTGSPILEYSMALRLAEQYLIRAEARAQSGNISGAQDDLNVIRNRAGLDNTTASTQEDMLDAILHERQVELFTEWGHRWFDLKRTGKADEVMAEVSSYKGGSWSPYKKLWPIAQTEINRNSNLFQNEGYDGGMM